MARYKTYKDREDKYIHLDVETYSECDLKAAGSYAYAQHPTTEVLCVCWRWDRGRDTGRWVPGNPFPPELYRALTESKDLIVAHNCQFDSEIWKRVLTPQFGWPWPGYDRFLDSQACAQIYNLPGKLDLAAAFVTGVGKDKAGYAHMLKMCKPARPVKDDSNPKRMHTPENIERLVDYCVEDVRAERDFMLQIPAPSPAEEEVWRATWAMNNRGVRIDTGLINMLLPLAEGAQNYYRGFLAEATDGAIDAETQRKRLGPWLVEHGAKLPLTPKGNPSFSKQNEHLIDMSEADEQAQGAFRLYNMLNNSSLSKLPKMLACACPDERIRGMTRYSGAGQTGRWAGQDVQLQNIYRGIIETLDEYEVALDMVRSGCTWEDLEFQYGNSLNLISTLIRPCLIPSVGCRFDIADYSAIEGRVLAWMAGEDAVLDAYRAGKRIYAVDAAAVFGCTYEDVMIAKASGNSKMDKVGKVVNLACGYQGGHGAFMTMGGRKLGLTDDRIQEIIAAWREERWRTKKLWYTLQEVAIRAIENPGRWHDAGPVQFGYNARTKQLQMRLPSGRKLYYHRAHLTEKKWPDGGTTPQIKYYGVDGQKCGWLSTYGGKLCENATQAIARDLLADATVRAHKMGYRLVMTIHDELVADQPLGDKLDLSALCQLMGETPEWAAGCPVKAEGFSGAYYRKG